VPFGTSPQEAQRCCVTASQALPNPHKENVMKLSASTLEASIELSREIAKEHGVALDKAVGIHLGFLKATATEKSDQETRDTAKTLIRNIFEADPHAEYDPKQVAGQVGLKSTGQADPAFVRNQIRNLRIEFKTAA
jgi:hypothetical protein